MMLVIQLTQSLMQKTLEVSSQLQCDVLEAKPVEGLGNVLDAILVNGTLKKHDTIIVCGMNGLSSLFFFHSLEWSVRPNCDYRADIADSRTTQGSSSQGR